MVLGQNSAFSRLAGGIGGRGPGETKLETDRRRVRDRIHRLEVELAAQRKRREQRRKERLRQQVPTISTRLHECRQIDLAERAYASHVLAKKECLRRWILQHDDCAAAGQEVIINDTVGSFATCRRFAVRVQIDPRRNCRQPLAPERGGCRDPRWQHQISSVDRILTELEFNRIPRLLVFNKADTLDYATVDSMVRHTSIQNGGECIAISALRPDTLGPLLQNIGQTLGRAVEKYRAPQLTTNVVQ